MSDCWYMPHTVENRRAESRFTPNRPGSYEALAALGLAYKHFNPDEVSDDVDTFIKPLLAKLGYHAYDIVNLAPATLGETKFESLAAAHFDEHIHEDDEVRLILEGSGYFDVRDEKDRWIRILSKPGDCLVVPAGIYHRFTTDEHRYIKTVRLFKENPKWIALSRANGDGDRSPARAEYLRLRDGPRKTIAGPAAREANHVFSLLYPTFFNADMLPIVTAFAKVVEARKAATSGGDGGSNTKDFGALVLFVTGAASPFAAGESWCPDCVAAKPAVLDALQQLRARFALKGSDGNSSDAVFLVEAPVERAAYMENKNFLYRTHELLQVRGVPTVFVFTLKDGAAEALLAEEGKTFSEKKWFDFLDVRVRQEDPTTSDVLLSF